MLNTIKKCFCMAKHLTQELGRDPSPSELSKYLNLPAGKVEEIMSLSQETASLDTNVDEDRTTRLADLICDEVSVEAFDKVCQHTLHETLDDVLGYLSPREIRIIQLRFGLGGEGPYTLQETGEILRITRERVRQIQEKAIAKLRRLRKLRELRDLL
jgi:RNA polymerase primary sigma factor